MFFFIAVLSITEVSASVLSKETVSSRALQRNDYNFSEWCDDDAQEACMEIWREPFPGIWVDNYLATFNCGALGPPMWDLYQCFLDPEICPTECEDFEDAILEELFEDGLGESFCGNYFEIDGSLCKYFKSAKPEWINPTPDVPGGYLCDHARVDICVAEKSAAFGQPELITLFLDIGCPAFAPPLHDLYSCYTEFCPAYCREEDWVADFQVLFDESSRQCAGFYGEVCPFLDAPRPEVTNETIVELECTEEEEASLAECIEIGESAFGSPELIEAFLEDGCEVFGSPLWDLYSCYKDICPEYCWDFDLKGILDERFADSSRQCAGTWGDVCDFINGPRPGGAQCAAEDDLNECIATGESAFGSPELIQSFLENGCDAFGPPMWDLYRCYPDNCPEYCTDPELKEVLDGRFTNSSRQCAGWWGDVCDFVDGPKPEAPSEVDDGEDGDETACAQKAEMDQCVAVASSVFGNPETIEAFLNGGENACDVFGPEMHDLYSCYPTYCPEYCTNPELKAELDTLFEDSSRECAGWWGDVCVFVAGPRPSLDGEPEDDGDIEWVGPAIGAVFAVLLLFLVLSGRKGEAKPAEPVDVKEVVAEPNEGGEVKPSV